MINRFKFRAWNGERMIYNANNNSPLQLMQCTGLKDKNGVLIYEGDVLAFNKNKNDIGVVKYGDFLPVDIINEYQSETLSIGFYYEPQNVQLEPFCWNCQLIPFFLEKSKAEVIGNIYENPELLEENKKC